MIRPRRMRPASPEDVATRNGLGGLAQPHVVSQSRRPAARSAPPPRAGRVETAFHGLERCSDLSWAESLFDEGSEPVVLPLEASSPMPGSSRDPDDAPVGITIEQVLDQLQPPGRFFPVSCSSRTRTRRRSCSIGTT